jgi:integrase
MGVFKRGKVWVAKHGDDWLGTRRTKKDADRLLADHILRETDPSSLTLSSFTTEWIASLNVDERTVTDYATTTKQLVALMGDPRLDAITTRSIVAAVSASSERYQPNTIRKQVTRLRQMLGDAVRWGYLPTVPDTKGLSLPRVQRKRVTPLTKAQAQHLLDAADDYWRLAIRTALVTGLRQEELFGLTLPDVTRGAVVVNQKMYNGALGPLKSDAAHRTIPLPSATYAALRRRMKDVPATRDGLLFPTPWGSPVNTHTWSTIMVPIAESAGMPDVRLHDLRHCYASMLIAGGATPKVLQEMMGHSTITITYDTYGHLMPNEARGAARGVGARLGL